MQKIFSKIIIFGTSSILRRNSLNFGLQESHLQFFFNHLCRFKWIFLRICSLPIGKVRGRDTSPEPVPRTAELQLRFRLRPGSTTMLVSEGQVLKAQVLQVFFSQLIPYDDVGCHLLGGQTWFKKVPGENLRNFRNLTLVVKNLLIQAFLNVICSSH